jgi:hypothetical protein
MTKPLADRQLTDEEFERRSAALVAEYAGILKEGFPESKLAKWNEKLDKLPPGPAKVIRQSVEISNTLKDALMGRDKPGHPKWADKDPKGISISRG